VMKMAARTRRPLSTLHVNAMRSTMRPYSVSTSMILCAELKVKRPRAVANSVRRHSERSEESRTAIRDPSLSLPRGTAETARSE